MSGHLDGSFHIASDEVDVAALRQRVEAGMARRPPLSPDPAALLARFHEPVGASAQDEVGFAVVQLRMILDNPLPSDRMVRSESPLGALLDRGRGPLHAIARYYVDALASRQDEIASWVATALAAVASDDTIGRGTEAGTGGTGRDGAASAGRDLVSLAHDVAALREELRQMRAEIDALRRAAADGMSPTATPRVSDPEMVHAIAPSATDPRVSPSDAPPASDPEAPPR
ncbi:MAG: hypothetical protein EPO26_04700 [Chloroflexota bacterium]|nr:MAG: hypothetical protein EPO26_04700 [Chloroflexota bacterium]